MHTEKKRSKDDTWKAADLKRYIAERGHEDDRQRDDRRHRGDSVEKPYKESRREGDKHREYYIRDREDANEMYRHAERRKEASRDRRSDREKDRREEKDRGKDRKKEQDKIDSSTGDYYEKMDRRRDREEIRDRQRDPTTKKKRITERQEREKETRREEQDQKYKLYREQRSHEITEKGGVAYIDKYKREQREQNKEKDRHREEYESKREKERREKHAEKRHSERKEDKEYQGDRKKDRDDKERRHKEQRHKQRHHSESRELRDPSRTEEESGIIIAMTKRKKLKNREKDKESQQIVSSKLQKTEETKSNEDEPEQEYEDDFEEYEDDFEELNESDDEVVERQQLAEHKEELSPEKKEEIKAIQKAMDEENKKVGALSRQNTTENEEETPTWFRDSEKTESKTSQPGKFMDFVAAKQREVNKKVATKLKKRTTELLRLIDLDFTLTSSLLDLPPVNEYDMYIRNFGTANTKQAYVQCNEDNADRDIQTEDIELCEKWTQHPPEHSEACGDSNISSKTRENGETDLNFDSKRLTTFLQSASQVMIVLLEENQAEKSFHRKLKTQTDVLSFSDGSLQLNTKLPFLHGRHISLIHFSQVQKHTMISVHNSTTTPSADHLDNTLSSAYGIFGSHLDLRRFFCMNQRSNWMSFQLASLDESGILNFWVVVELPKANEAGSQTDLGLRPGGKVKLLHSSSLSVADRMTHKARNTEPMQTLQLKLLPTDPNHFFIGTNMGIVHHGTSHGLKALPKFYRYQETKEKPVDINSLCFSPFRQDLFMVGCGDGCIRLHAVNQEKPLTEWRDACAGQSVVSVQWSQTRPAVFSVLDAASNIYLWDLLKNQTQPVITERMGKDSVTAMALFGDSGQRNTYSGFRAALLLGYCCLGLKDLQVSHTKLERALRRARFLRLWYDVTVAVYKVYKMVATGEQNLTTTLVLPSHTRFKSNVNGRTNFIANGTAREIQKVNFDEDSDEISFEPDFKVRTPYVPPVVEDTPEPAFIPLVKAKKKKRRKKKAVSVEEESEEEPEPVKSASPVIHEEFMEIVLPEIPLPPVPPAPPKPVPVHRKPAPLPRVPSPELPSFLQEFMNKEWFKQLYPDKKNISSTLTPDLFFLQLVDYLYLILPPLHDRPFLLDFPNYISLPLPHIKLSPFNMDSEEDHLTFLDHRYYIMEKSHVGYYR
ncbi:hypothetical protein WMY93_030166 [Mugilogobius chulae]|uniref:WD repeat-containing protein 60 n=1 Tax=Mugilogobius chulae TaxID=88201 RepID=A0AAW0MX17_9GOBI